MRLWGMSLLIGIFALGFSSPYAALLIDRVSGPSQTEIRLPDGMQTMLRIDASEPLPDWIPVPGDGEALEPGRFGAAGPILEGGRVTILTGEELPALRAFYRAALAREGFKVEEMDADGVLRARHRKSGRDLHIALREHPSSLWPVRMAEIIWTRTKPGSKGSWDEMRLGLLIEPVAGTLRG